ncbi:hypothetical protein [Methylobacter sp. S3L5C]|uniref:phage tail terminator protein n=1 Tax=Methylobacter sp. S3L5C TaxID=2839024 RepID=UPI001FAE6952|nr:hypothetical protein [Methylobacter sp. S3L5C]UOA07622.1 hypothetical protein KKZ03_15330 [Methylobacter sp. S3L5C]
MATNLRPLIEARIRTQIPAFKEVAGAADLTNVMAGRLSDAGCYIFHERVTATESDLIGATMQRLAVSFAILIAVRNVRDARGGDAADASYLLQDSVKSALLGWCPDASADPLEYSGGALVSFANGFFIWKESFITHQFIRSGV